MSVKQVTVLLNQLSSGNKQVIDQVFSLLYAEIKVIAGFQLNKINTGQTITPTVLANECYLKLLQNKDLTVENKRHFLNYLSRSMRLFLIDTLRSKSSKKRNAQQVKGNITEYVGDEDVSFKLIEVDKMLGQVEKVDVRLSEVLQYKLIFNLTFKEIAATLSMSERQVMRLWKQSKALMMAMLEINKGDVDD